MLNSQTFKPNWTIFQIVPACPMLGSGIGGSRVAIQAVPSIAGCHGYLNKKQASPTPYPNYKQKAQCMCMMHGIGRSRSVKTIAS